MNKDQRDPCVLLYPTRARWLLVSLDLLALLLRGAVALDANYLGSARRRDQDKLTLH